MTAVNRNAGVNWTRERVALLALVCLMAGIGGGWFIRGMRNPVEAHSAKAAAPAAPGPGATGVTPPPLNPNQAKETADAQAVPLLDRLKTDPNNLEALTSLGNLYYDARQYSTAIDYYQRALKVTPADAAVRTDLGTAYWYLGNADAAIAEFDTVLSYAPDNPNTLFNRGLIKWQGKKDAAGAVADWQKLLATDPNYENKDQVKKLLAEVAAGQSSR